MFTYKGPKFVLGNLIIGERFAEPQGKAHIENITTGEYAEIDFYKRAMFGNKSEDINSVKGTIYDADRQPKYKFGGKYTDKITVMNVSPAQYGITTTLFRVPNFVPTEQDPKKIYGLNRLALQMNYLTDELR